MSKKARVSVSMRFINYNKNENEMKMKKRSHRYGINRLRPTHGHKYTIYDV